MALSKEAVDKLEERPEVPLVFLTRFSAVLRACDGRQFVACLAKFHWSRMVRVRSAVCLTLARPQQECEELLNSAATANIGIYNDLGRGLAKAPRFCSAHSVPTQCPLSAHWKKWGILEKGFIKRECLSFNK